MEAAAPAATSAQNTDDQSTCQWPAMALRMKAQPSCARRRRSAASFDAESLTLSGGVWLRGGAPISRVSFTAGLAFDHPLWLQPPPGARHRKSNNEVLGPVVPGRHRDGC